MRKYLLLFSFSFCVLIAAGQISKDFYYTRTYAHADFNSSALDSAAYELMDCNCLKNIHFIVEGDYTILQYERYRYGELYLDTVGFVRDVFLLKVKNDIIIESYFIPCDWKEPPITAVILSSSKHISFKQKIKIKKLELTNMESGTLTFLSYDVAKKMRYLLNPFHY